MEENHCSFQKTLFQAHTFFSAFGFNGHLNNCNVVSAFTYISTMDKMLRTNGPDARKPVFRACEQQRRRPACLISAFVIRLLESIISKLATSEIIVV